jgi:hypothetical protein
MGILRAFGTRLGLTGRKPKDIAPSIFAISTQKNLAVLKVYLREFLIAKLNKSTRISLNQISEFVDLWTRVNEVHLVNLTIRFGGVVCEFSHTRQKLSVCDGGP